LVCDMSFACWIMRSVLDLILCLKGLKQIQWIAWKFVEK